MTVSRAEPQQRTNGPASLAAPVQWSESLGRRIRSDAVETLGDSTQTLAERALAAGDWEGAADLAEYFLDEMTRINTALYTWLTVILAFPDAKFDHASTIVDGMSGFGPGDGDLTAVLAACRCQDERTSRERLETMRIRVTAVHDQLVWWIQQLLAGIAERYGEPAVCDLVLRTYDELWRDRYAAWDTMTPIERLQISVEGMRGHLSGPGRRGDVGILEEADRFVMILDPCGSCGVLRRGDPDSGRPGCDPAGTKEPHEWAGDRLGFGWYAVHSTIVMEWLQTKDGLPPMRPLEGCDSDGPCRWFIYKEGPAAREGVK